MGYIAFYEQDLGMLKWVSIEFQFTSIKTLIYAYYSHFLKYSPSYMRKVYIAAIFL